MNRLELKGLLEKEHISPNAYSLYGPTGGEDLYVLEERFGTWFVYYTERGMRIGEQIFNTENEACEYIISEILKDPTTRLRNKS